MSGRIEGVDAVAGEFVWGNVVTDISGDGSFLHQVFDHVVESALSLGDLLVVVEEHRKLSSVDLAVTVFSALALDVGIGGEHCFQTFDRGSRPVADFVQLSEMVADLSLMPGGEDAFDIREVLVESGAADPGLLGYLGHGHGPQALFGH